MNTNDSKTFWQYDINYWYQKTGSSENGLSQTYANRMLAQNAASHKSKPLIFKDLKLFLGQFINPLMLMLLGAVILSAFLGDISEVVIILFIVLSAGILGFIQERNAGRVVEKLQSLISVKVRYKNSA